MSAWVHVQAAGTVLVKAWRFTVVVGTSAPAPKRVLKRHHSHTIGIFDLESDGHCLLAGPHKAHLRHVARHG